MNPWRIELGGYDPQKAVENGNRFLIGNGFVGVRGTLEEYTAEYLPAINLAGVYDRNAMSLWREPVNAPNGLYVGIENAGRILKHKQCLDIRHALHSRETVYENGSLYIERFASMANPNLICQRVIKRGDIRLKFDIDTNVWDINGPHLFDIRRVPDGVEAVTGEKKAKITVYTRQKKTGSSDDPSEERFDRFITVNAPPFSGGYEEEFAKHCALWDRLWENSEVRIEGDERAQLALNYSLYHLHSIMPRHANNLSIPARGLSGQTYKGAVFWDTEIFLLPFFAWSEPEAAKKLVRYRIDTLEGAHKKAEEYGFKGAFYAWESQEGGAEACTDFNVTDVFTGRPVRTYFRDKQIHISADVVYALQKYAEITGDVSVLAGAGGDAIKACAEFFLSRAYRRESSEELEFTDVIGPDEYHERVDNNAFTNKLAKFVLEQAGMDRKVRGARMRHGVIEQFDGYFKLEDAALSEVKSRLKHPQEYWGTPSGVAYPTQIIKQADVIAMLSLFPDDYTQDEVLRNWEYYEPRTEHGSSLSATMYALAACRIGRADWAYPLFMKSALADLEGGGKSWAGGVYIGGTHPAAAGGAWQIAAFGFAGLKLKDGELSLQPCLPDGITKISFPITFRGRKLRVCVTREKSEILERS
jgi:kojibiose phosphorylase/nigerose phosphorylase